MTPLTLLAVGSDAAVYWFVSDHYDRHGHFGLPIHLALMAVAFSAATVYATVACWREVHKTSRPKQINKSVRSPHQKGRTRKEQP